MLPNWKEPNPVTAPAAIRQVNVPFCSNVTLKIISLTKFWLGIQSMPYWFPNPGWGPAPEESTPAMTVVPKNIAKEVNFKSVKSNCQLKLALLVSSRSRLLLKWPTGLGTACTIWVGGGSFQVKLLQSEKSKASMSYLMIESFLSPLKKNS